MSAHVAALVGLAAAGLIAALVYGTPVPLVLASAGFGAACGLLPIGWLILNALYIYRLSVETGQFAVLQKQIAGVSGDRRIQAILIAFASVATGGQPESPAAGTILRAVFWHSLALATLMGVFIMAQAYLWLGVVPK